MRYIVIILSICCSRQHQWKSEYITSLFPHMFHGLQPFVRHVNHDELKFVRLTSSSLPSICLASYNHGKECAQHGHECGGTASLYAAVSSAEIRHHLGQAGRSDSSDVQLWHQHPAYTLGGVGHEQRYPRTPSTMCHTHNSTREGISRFYLVNSRFYLRAGALQLMSF